MVEPTITFGVTLAATVAASVLSWVGHQLHRDARDLIERLEAADERSRDNADVLADHELIEDSEVDHIRTRRPGHWRRND